MKHRVYRWLSLLASCMPPQSHRRSNLQPHLQSHPRSYLRSRLRSALTALAAVAMLSASAAALAIDDKPPMAIENGGRMEFIHAIRSGKLTAAQKTALEARLMAECEAPTNPITQGMIETRGPGKCMAFVRNQCNCTDCEMPTYCLPPEAR